MFRAQEDAASWRTSLDVQRQESGDKSERISRLEHEAGLSKTEINNLMVRIKGPRFAILTRSPPFYFFLFYFLRGKPGKRSGKEGQLDNAKMEKIIEDLTANCETVRTELCVTSALSSSQ